MLLFFGLSLWLMICQLSVLMQEPQESVVLPQLEEKIRRLEFELQQHVKKIKAIKVLI